jgi:hypothetical protein
MEPTKRTKKSKELYNFAEQILKDNGFYFCHAYWILNEDDLDSGLPGICVGWSELKDRVWISAVTNIDVFSQPIYCDSEIAVENALLALIALVKNHADNLKIQLEIYSILGDLVECSHLNHHQVMRLNDLLQSTQYTLVDDLRTLANAEHKINLLIMKEKYKQGKNNDAEYITILNPVDTIPDLLLNELWSDADEDKLLDNSLNKK